MRLFKRPSTSPQLVSATPLSQDEVSETTGAVNEVSANLEDAETTPKVNNDDTENTSEMPPPSSSFSARKSVSTWGRKVGRRWEQLKRSDSSELLSVSGRRQRWSPNRKSFGDTNEDLETSGVEGSLVASLTKPKRISRVESLRNLFRAGDHRGSSSNINVDISTRSGTIEEEDDITSIHNHYALDKALSEGALRNVSQFRLSSDEYRTETLQEKSQQLNERIKSFQEHKQVFDYILKNHEIIKTQKGMTLARDALEKVQTVLQNNSDNTEEDELTSSNSDLNKSDASTQTLESSKPRVKRNLFSVRTSTGDSERSEQRRSFAGSGIEELMCTMRLGCDESGYDSDSTRAGADSPDSEKAVPSTLKRRSFSITSEDYQGIDLSLRNARTPHKKDATTVTSRKPEMCGESISGDCVDSTFEASIRTETTLMSEDDTDSCDENTFSDLPEFKFTGCLPPRNPEAAIAQRTCIRKPKKIVSQNSMISENLIAKKNLQKTPIKRTPSINENAIPLSQRLRLQNFQKDRKTQIVPKGRRTSNVSVLNLLENAASPSKDSPPASKICIPSHGHCIPYYSPKRSRSNLEQDGIDVAAAMNPVKRVVHVTPVVSPPSKSATKTLVRRELKTMKLVVNKESNLGISVEKREAVRPFYVVSRLDASGEAAKSKQIRVGDEVVRVSGRRLRGMSLAEARNAVKNCTGTVELQIAREPTFNFDGELGDTWGEPIIRTKSDTAVWTLNENSPKKLDNIADNACRIEKNDQSNNCRIVGALTKNGKSVSMHTMPTINDDDNEKTKITGMKKFQTVNQRNSMPAARSGRPNTLSSDLRTVILEKGATKKLGFSIVGGSDSVKGSIGIFVKNVMHGGQAAEEGTLRAGDEILAINGQLMDGVTHAKALQYFKAAKPGRLIIHVGRRDPANKRFITRR